MTAWTYSHMRTFRSRSDGQTVVSDFQICNSIALCEMGVQLCFSQLYDLERPRREAAGGIHYFYAEA